MTFNKDMLERLLATGAESFLAVFILTDLSSAKSALIAAGAAVLASVKGLLAKQVGTHGTASMAD